MTPATDEAPEPFSEGYAKAHRSYGLASSILLAWELVGIEFDPKPFADLAITLKSPDAIPYVLVALVLYFAFRLTVEWLLLKRATRASRPALADFGVAHLIGCVSLGVLAFQVASRRQVFDIAVERLPDLVPGLAGVVLPSLVRAVRLVRRNGRHFGADVVAITIVLCSAATALVLGSLVAFGPWRATIAFAIGLCLSLLLNAPFRWYFNRKRQESLSSQRR